MVDKPATADGYLPAQVRLTKEALLYLATKLNDLMEETVVIGGLVPSLIIDQGHLPNGVLPHVGSMDIDVGLTLALLDGERYKTVEERLRTAGFSPDHNDKGNVTRHRWKLEVKGKGKVTLDFLIPLSKQGDKGGKLRDLTKDMAALLADGLEIAFKDRMRVPLSGKTIYDETANRDIWVCGPGAFVVLKALAFRDRGENKDAYDLFYVVRNYGEGPKAVAARLATLRNEEVTPSAIGILQQDFAKESDVGPKRVAKFMTGGDDKTLQADVVSFTAQLLAEYKEHSAAKPKKKRT